MNEISPSMTFLSGRKRVLALAVAAVAVVGLTGVGAIATSSTGIYNNQFIKDAVPAGFTFTGTPFSAHYNSGSASATEVWTAKNASTTQLAIFDGIFALKTTTDLPLALAQHLKVEYKLVDMWGTHNGNGGTLANPISLGTSIGLPSGIPLVAGGTDTVAATLTWDGTDPAPTREIDAIADFNVNYSMNPNT